MNNFDFSWITGAIDDLMSTHQQVFLNEGFILLHSLGVIILISYSLKWGLESVSRWHGVFNLAGLLQFLMMYLLAEAMLRYYLTPLPWGGQSLSAIRPITLNTYSRMIDISRLDVMMAHVNAILTNTERPAVINIGLIMPYLLVEADMIVLTAVLFAVNAVGFGALAIGRLLGPLFIPFFIVPRLSWLFWNWMQFILQYSLYRVVAAGLLYVTSNLMTTFFTNAIRGDYTAAHMGQIVLAMTIVTIACLWMVFKTPSISGDLAKGASSSGIGFIGGVTNFMRGAFA